MGSVYGRLYDVQMLLACHCTHLNPEPYTKPGSYRHQEESRMKEGSQACNSDMRIFLQVVTQLLRGLARDSVKSSMATATRNPCDHAPLANYT